MKTIFTLVASLIMGISVFAADAKPKSMLTIKSFDKGDIKVVIDGKRFESGFSSIRITDIDAGYHSIKVYRQENTSFFSLLIKRYEVVYNTSLLVKPFSEILITIDQFGRTSVSEEKTRGNGYGRNKDWDDDHGYNYDRDGKWGDYDNDRGYDDRRFGGTMNNVEFNRVLNSIQREWFESNKMKSAKQIISSNLFTSSQVKQMLQLFNFESNKLELAKLAYTKTVDKQNYQCVSEMLTFRSSKEELARFIRDCR